MSQTYSTFIEKFSKINYGIKVKIVIAPFWLKVIFVVVLAVLKIIFSVLSLPYFLFIPVQHPSSNDNSKKPIAANPQRFQQAMVLSFFTVVILTLAFQALIFSMEKAAQASHGATSKVTDVSGSREYEQTTPAAIKEIYVSPFEHEVTFKGTGPAYAQVAVFVDNGESIIGTTKVNEQGEWQFIKTPEEGNFSQGQHSSVVIFYSDDGNVLGKPTAVKSFEIPRDFFFSLYRSLGLNTIIFTILTIVVLSFSVIKLRKTVKV